MGNEAEVSILIWECLHFVKRSAWKF